MYKDQVVRETKGDVEAAPAPRLLITDMLNRLFNDVYEMDVVINQVVTGFKPVLRPGEFLYQYDDYENEENRSDMVNVLGQIIARVGQQQQRLRRIIEASELGE